MAVVPSYSAVSSYPALYIIYRARELVEQSDFALSPICLVSNQRADYRV